MNECAELQSLSDGSWSEGNSSLESANLLLGLSNTPSLCTGPTARCTDITGGFYCQCGQGYMLQNDGYTCIGTIEGKKLEMCVLLYIMC